MLKYTIDELRTRLAIMKAKVRVVAGWIGALAGPRRPGARACLAVSQASEHAHV